MHRVLVVHMKIQSCRVLLPTIRALTGSSATGFLRGRFFPRRRLAKQFDELRYRSRRPADLSEEMSKRIATCLDKGRVEDCHFRFAQRCIPHEVGPRSPASGSGPVDELDLGLSQAQRDWPKLAIAGRLCLCFHRRIPTGVYCIMQYRPFAPESVKKLDLPIPARGAY